MAISEKCFTQAKKARIGTHWFDETNILHTVTILDTFVKNTGKSIEELSADEDIQIARWILHIPLWVR